MRIRDPKSIIVIFVYLLVNVAIIGLSYLKLAGDSGIQGTPKELAPEFTEIEQLNYFHLRAGVPQMSLRASSMRALEDRQAEFKNPIGTYKNRPENPIHYQALEGFYQKDAELLTLQEKVKITSNDGRYFADRLNYHFKKDLLLGRGNIRFVGQDPKTRDSLDITSESMRANPEAQLSHFKGQVKGKIIRKKAYEGGMDFTANELQMDGPKSLAHLTGDVFMKRESYRITAEKADIYLENFNKSLKYFVLNDDVKVVETVETPKGVIQRRAFAERLEGFGRDQKMVLSGAPRVEQGDDVIKGYRITVRENVDLIEVEDAMSDMQMKRKKN
jgi:lipopolysaccharide transport protein LptA